MSRDELVAKLRAITDAPQDPEIAHSEADKALIAYINDPEIAALYERVERWYA